MDDEKQEQEHMMMHEVTSNKKGIAILSLSKVEEYRHAPLRDTVHLLRIFNVLLYS